MKNENTKITINTQGQFIVSGGDSNILINEKTSCNSGSDLRLLLNSNGKCSKVGFNVKGLVEAGQTAEPDEAYKQDQNSTVSTSDVNNIVNVECDAFHLAGQIENGNVSNAGVTMESLTGALIYECGKKSNLEFRGGFSRTIEQDDCGKYKFGWYDWNNEYLD